MEHMKFVHKDPNASGVPGKNNKKLVKYEELLKELHVKPVHYKPEEVKTCEDQCPQQNCCACIRDVINLLDQIMEKMSEKFPIFKDVKIIVVGSLKEQTKIGGLGIISQYLQNHKTSLLKLS